MNILKKEINNNINNINANNNNQNIIHKKLNNMAYKSSVLNRGGTGGGNLPQNDNNKKLINHVESTKCIFSNNPLYYATSMNNINVNNKQNSRFTNKDSSNDNKTFMHNKNKLSCQNLSISSIINKNNKDKTFASSNNNIIKNNNNYDYNGDKNEKINAKSPLPNSGTILPYKQKMWQKK